MIQVTVFRADVQNPEVKIHMILNTQLATGNFEL